MGGGSSEALSRGSVGDPADLWGMVISERGLVFDREPTSIRGSDDVTRPEWLPGASYNIVRSCLDHDPGSIAIVAGTPSGMESVSVRELSDRVAGFAA